MTERGFTLTTHGDRLFVSPGGDALTDNDRAWILANKAKLITELEHRRRRDGVLMQLADSPGVKYALTVETGGDPVILAVAIRDLATFEMTIPAHRYDPFKLLELLESGPDRPPSCPADRGRADNASTRTAFLHIADYQEHQP